MGLTESEYPQNIHACSLGLIESEYHEHPCLEWALCAEWWEASRPASSGHACSFGTDWIRISMDVHWDWLNQNILRISMHVHLGLTESEYPQNIHACSLGLIESEYPQNSHACSLGLIESEYSRISMHVHWDWLNQNILEYPCMFIGADWVRISWTLLGMSPLCWMMGSFKTSFQWPVFSQA